MELLPHHVLDLRVERLSSLDTVLSHLVIETMKPSDVRIVSDLIRENILKFDEYETVISSTLRRLAQFANLYNGEDSEYLVARLDDHADSCIGGAGIGSLHGLPREEGVGELRDFFVDQNFRNHGVGRYLLNACLSHARRLGYRRLYLETTPQMQVAQSLFLRHGFRPIHCLGKKETASASFASAVSSYYILENLS